MVSASCVHSERGKTMNDDERDALSRLADYDGAPLRVTEHHGAILTAFCGDNVPRLGEAVAIDADGQDTIWARVLGQEGNRHVRLHILSDPGASLEGASIERTGQQAAFPAPEGDVLDLSGASWVPDTVSGALGLRHARPGFAELEPNRPAAKTGIRAIDALSPIARHGITVVLDARPTPDAFLALVRRALPGLEASAILGTRSLGAHDLLTHTVDAPDVLTGLRAVMSWAPSLRMDQTHTLVLVDVPAWRVTPDARPHALNAASDALMTQVLTRLGDALVSTQSGRITTLARLQIDESASALGDIAETMGLGDVDAQLLLDADGVWDPRRSRSSADTDEDARAWAMQARAALGVELAAQDKLMMFGEDELTRRELDALELARGLSVSVL